MKRGQVWDHSCRLAGGSNLQSLQVNKEWDGGEGRVARGVRGCLAKIISESSHLEINLKFQKAKQE